MTRMAAATTTLPSWFNYIMFLLFLFSEAL